jgi:hypothetical protein
MQEFKIGPNSDLAIILSFLLVAVAGIADFLSLLPGPINLILVLVAIVLMVLVFLGRNPFDLVHGGALSQNLIARYEPAGQGRASASTGRKVVLVAHMDTNPAKVLAKSARGPVFLKMRILCLVCIALAALLLIVQLLPLPGIVGQVASVLLLVVGLFMLVMAIIRLKECFGHSTTGANYNFSALAALSGIAQRLGAIMPADKQAVVPSSLPTKEAVAPEAKPTAPPRPLNDTPSTASAARTSRPVRPTRPVATPVATTDRLGQDILDRHDSHDLPKGGSPRISLHTGDANSTAPIPHVDGAAPADAAPDENSIPWEHPAEPELTSGNTGAITTRPPIKVS